jgi:hypothetical protein
VDYLFTNVQDTTNGEGKISDAFRAERQRYRQMESITGGEDT